MKKKMTYRIALIAGLLLAAGALFGLSLARAREATSQRAPVGSAFNYQGRLDESGLPANGPYDFKFGLWDSPSAGSQVGVTLTQVLSVTNGVFTTSLDFGTGVFDGEARYLALGVRPSGPGAYFPLTPRQALSAVPYASYASASDWNGLVDMPADIADGDAGAFPERQIAPRHAISTTLLSSGTVGAWTSVTIGTDGLPIISFYDHTTTDVKVAHCVDQVCSAANIYFIDNSIQAQATSIAIGSDGLPIISYYSSSSSGSLRMKHCSNPACSAFTGATVDSGSVGWYSSIAVGSDGLPIISYQDFNNYEFQVAHCDDLFCSTSSISMLDTNPFVGSYTSIAIGIDGLPIISYFDDSNDDLKVAHCNDLACSSATITPHDTANQSGKYNDITIGVDGLPVISYREAVNDDLKVAHCNNPACTSATYAIVDSAGQVGSYSDITIGANGLPIISYLDETNGNLKVAHCLNLTCSAAVTTTIDSAVATATFTAITIGTDGLPFISYRDHTNADLKAAHCSNPFCIPYFRRR